VRRSWRQSRLAVARAIGAICGTTGHTAVVHVHAALSARERAHAVVTSDPHDVRRIDPVLPVIGV
jgi:hypothetical protein